MLGQKNQNPNFIMKAYVIYVFGDLTTHGSSSIKRGLIREKLKLLWKHPLERPCDDAGPHLP